MLKNKVCLNKLYNMLFFMNWIRFTNRLFGARIQINEPDRVQFETNEPLIIYGKDPNFKVLLNKIYWKCTQSVY